MGTVFAGPAPLLLLTLRVPSLPFPFRAGCHLGLQVQVLHVGEESIQVKEMVSERFDENHITYI